MSWTKNGKNNLELLNVDDIQFKKMYEFHNRLATFYEDENSLDIDKIIEHNTIANSNKDKIHISISHINYLKISFPQNDEYKNIKKI